MFEINPDNNNNNNNINNNNKKTIKVIVFIDTQRSGIVAHKKHVGTGEGYEGYAWELFQKCMVSPSLKNKYKFDIHYTDLGWSNYDQTIKDIEAGKYDIAIAAFYHTENWERVVNLSTPILIDANAIFHIQDDREVITDILNTILLMSKYTIFIIILGIMIGLLLYYGNPKRIKYIRGITQHNFFIRSMITGVAAMFGEMGFLSENASHTYRGGLIVIVGMFIAYVSLIIIQAKVTSVLVEKRISKGLNKYTMNKGLILGHEGEAVGRKIQADGARLQYIKDKTTDELMKFYMDNTNKYKGVAISYCEAFHYLEIYHNLEASIGYGYEPSSYAVNRNQVDFLNDLNITLLELRKTRVMEGICKKYFGDIPYIPVCSLR